MLLETSKPRSSPRMASMSSSATSPKTAPKTIDEPTISNCPIHRAPREPRERRLHSASEVPDDPDHQGGEDEGVVDPAQIEHFDPEERAGDGRPEHRREAGGDAADHEPPSVLIVEAQDIREQAGDRGADLGRGTFLPDRAAEGEGEDGGGSFIGATIQGIRPEPGASPQSRPRYRGPAPRGEPRISTRRPERRAGAATPGRTPPGVSVLTQSRSRDRPQERARPESDAEPGARAQERPLERADDESGVLRIPACLVREPRWRLLLRLHDQRAVTTKWARRFCDHADSSWAVANGRSLP